VLRYNVTREADGKRVEHTLPVGLVRDFPSESSAWLEVERQHLQLNQPDIRGRITFAKLAEHYIANELRRKKSHTTVDAYFRNLRNRLMPRWGIAQASFGELACVERR
jgi:hypothetical protein